MTWSGGSSRPWGRRASTRSSGTNTSSSSTSWLPGAPHAHGVPGVEHRHAFGRHGHGHVEHDPALVGVVEGEHRREDGAHRGLAGEDLAPADLVAALDPHGLAPGPGQVGAAGRHQHDALVGDAAQRGLGAGQAAAVAPGGEQHHVVVHRRGQGGRGAVPGQLPLGHRDLADRRAAAAELHRNGEGQVAAAAQEVVGLGDERAVTVVARRVLGDARCRARLAQATSSCSRSSVAVVSIVLMGRR